MAPALTNVQKLQHVNEIMPYDMAKSLQADAGPQREREPYWDIRGSTQALEAENPIRKIMDTLKPSENCEKVIISLGQGDPTVYGHLKAHENLSLSVIEAVQKGKSNGYAHSCGDLEGRRAVAEKYSGLFSKQVSPELEVILTSGCNHALELCFQALCNPGDNVLVPRPGYPLYESYIQFLGGEVRYYSLLPEKGWEIDLNEVHLLADERTVAFVVCNPGNPSGSVYSKSHLKEVLKTASSLRLLVIADEVYSGVTFSGFTYFPLASLEPSVPILTVSSLSKNYLVPGWRMGWIVISDWSNLLEKGRVIEAFHRILQFTASPCSLIQKALKGILADTPDSHVAETAEELESSSKFCCERLERIHGLSCSSPPQGSMFIMLRIDPKAYLDIKDDREWCSALLAEEAVVVIPGSAFKFPKFVRCVFALPRGVLAEAWDRIEAFCHRHSVQDLAL